jgi:hypothetical protein
MNEPEAILWVASIAFVAGILWIVLKSPRDNGPINADLPRLP